MLKCNYLQHLTQVVYWITGVESYQNSQDTVHLKKKLFKMFTF